VTANFFDVLGVRQALGRLLHLGIDEIVATPTSAVTAAQTLVLSYRAWHENFGGHSSVIGRRVLEPLSRLTYTIVGVAPPGFDCPAGAEYWQPMWSEWNSNVGAFAVARLAPGATLSAERVEYLAIESRVKPEYHSRGAHAATLWKASRLKALPAMLGLAQRLVKETSAIPGVVAVTPLVVPPLVGDAIWQVRFDKEGQSPSEANLNPATPAEMCGPGFFRTFGVPVIRGRAFTDGDDTTSALVAIVRESAARRLWPGEDPMGKRIRLRGAKREDLGGDSDWRTMIGVAKDTHLRTVGDASPIVIPARPPGILARLHRDSHERSPWRFRRHRSLG
jgi:hypothetical protein